MPTVEIKTKPTPKTRAIGGHFFAGRLIPIDEYVEVELTDDLEKMLDVKIEAGLLMKKRASKKAKRTTVKAEVVNEKDDTSIDELID